MGLTAVEHQAADCNGYLTAVLSTFGQRPIGNAKHVTIVLARISSS